MQEFEILRFLGSKEDHQEAWAVNQMAIMEDVQLLVPNVYKLLWWTVVEWSLAVSSLPLDLLQLLNQWPGGQFGPCRIQLVLPERQCSTSTLQRPIQKYAAAWFSGETSRIQEEIRRYRRLHRFRWEVSLWLPLLKSRHRASLSCQNQSICRCIGWAVGA